jgi:hypothetical protein
MMEVSLHNSPMLAAPRTFLDEWIRRWEAAYEAIRAHDVFAWVQRVATPLRSRRRR